MLRSEQAVGIEVLDCFQRLNWITQPTPVQSFDTLASDFGIEYLGVKRDDLIEFGFGGTKPRKLEYILRAEPFTSAARWSSVGAIGSGHLVALTAAAQVLERHLVAHCFWEPATDEVRETLAFIASGPTTLRYYNSRASLLLQRPKAILGWGSIQEPAIPPGGTCLHGELGTVRAGLELAGQIECGELPKPDCIYVSLGSGGTVVGLSVGLALAGIHTTIRAVSSVERVLAPKLGIHLRIRSLIRFLHKHGIRQADHLQPVPIEIVYNQVGAGYGIATKRSLESSTMFLLESSKGPRLEPLYTGKTAAALREDAAQKRLPMHVLFWNTARRGPLPSDPQWHDRLPNELAQRLGVVAPRRWTRRRLLSIGVVGLAAVGLSHQLTGYDASTIALQVLTNWQVQVISAAIEVFLPDVDKQQHVYVAENIDKFLLGMSIENRREIHALLGLIEHGTPIGLRLNRFTRLSKTDREKYLLQLAATSRLLAICVRGFRDLIMLGYFAIPSSWTKIGYEGTLLAANATAVEVESLRAPEGTFPSGWSFN